MKKRNSLKYDNIKEEKKMKTKAIFLSLLMLTSLFVVPIYAGKDVKGNDLPKGKSYNLNVIAVPNQKNANFDGGEGKRIFILQDSTTQVYVHGGDYYQVLDRDGTDGKVGTGKNDPGIVLPYMGTPLEGGHYTVDVYVRVVGYPGGKLDWTSMGYNETDGTYSVYIGSFTANKATKFSLHTSDLLNDDYQDILWTWSPNQDFKVMQLRFIEIE